MEMIEVADKIPYMSTAFILGNIIPAVLSLKIFTTRADMAEFKAEIAEKYMSKDDANRKLEHIETLLAQLTDRLDRVITGK